MDIYRIASALKKLRLRDWLFLTALSALILYMIISPLTAPSRAIHAVKDSSVDEYDAMFTRQNMVQVSDGGYSRTISSHRVRLMAKFQLSAQETQQLIEAKHLLTCQPDKNCTVEDLGPGLSSAGDYKTTSTYADGTTELYINSEANTATWIFRSI